MKVIEQNRFKVAEQTWTQLIDIESRGRKLLSPSLSLEESWQFNSFNSLADQVMRSKGQSATEKASDCELQAPKAWMLVVSDWDIRVMCRYT